MAGTTDASGTSVYECADGQRRLEAVRADPALGLNGIDILEVDAGQPGVPAQRTLVVRCLRPLPSGPAALAAGDVAVVGGVRADPAVNPVRTLWAVPADRLAAAHAATPALVTAADVAAFSGVAAPERCLVVRTSSAGDFSTYRLVVRRPADHGFDTRLAEAAFTFKVDCPTELDCRVERACPPERRPEPPIDYLSRDYDGLRRLLLDRLSLVLPTWTDRNPADLGVTLVELFAYLGDHLAYAQDAVAAEAYLGTARRRVSVRRHARLLDYPMHEGCAARTWLALSATDPAADGTVVAAGSRVRSADGTLAFHTLHDATVAAARTTLDVHTWGDLRCCLAPGATSATLVGTAAALGLGAGDVLVLAEVRGPSGEPSAADPTHRWAVRLVADPVDAVDPLTDPDTPLVEVRWHDEDALPFPLCLWQFPDPDPAPTRPDGLVGAAVAYGNVVLAEHGDLVGPEAPVPARVPADGRYRPTLDRLGLAHAVPYVDAGARGRSASAATDVRPEAAVPAVVGLDDGRDPWTGRRDLVASSRFDADYVVEMEDDGRAFLRFGDGVHGRRPPPGSLFEVTYHVGGGPAGNVGRDVLTRLDDPPPGVAVTNPLPARGGVGPEAVEQVRQWAPYAFRTQQRAVTDADYAEVTERHPLVQRAAGTRRWTGSWYTEMVTIDRRDGAAVSPDFRAEVRDHLERFRMAGVDVEVDSPVFVSLDIGLDVCVGPGAFRANVERALAELFSAGDLPDGRRGFFHPESFTFAQPVYLSRVVAAAMSVEGVDWVDVTRFRRWGRSEAGEREAGRIPIGRLEVARCDSDPNEPENGRIEFSLIGGA